MSIKVKQITICKHYDLDIDVLSPVHNYIAEHDILLLRFTVNSSLDTFAIRIIENGYTSNVGTFSAREGQTTNQICYEIKTYFNLYGVVSNSALAVEIERKPGVFLKLFELIIERTPGKNIFETNLNPIMLTSLGRSGSTLLMKLLSAHDQITVYGGYPYEAHVSSYWMQMFKVLSCPSSSMKYSLGQLIKNTSCIESFSSNVLNCVSTEELINFATGYHKSTLEHALKTIDSVYLSSSDVNFKGGAKYYAEKHLPLNIQNMLHEAYSKPKEIFLVRDFRDMYASIYLFNKKRNELSFNRWRVDSEEEYIVQLKESIELLHASYMQRKDRSILVKYEDLVSNTHIEINNILRYIFENAHGCTFSADILNGIIDATQMNYHMTSSSEFLIGNWQNVLEPDIKELCCRHFNDVLLKFGYVN